MKEHVMSQEALKIHAAVDVLTTSAPGGNEARYPRAWIGGGYNGDVGEVHHALIAGSIHPMQLPVGHIRSPI